MSWKDTVIMNEPKNIYPPGTDPNNPETGNIEWHDEKIKGPANPQVYEDFEWEIVCSNDDLISIAKDLKTKSKISIDELELARFNWGTKIEAEINWYLHYYCGCTETTNPRGTDKGHNFIFHKAPISQGIWIPKKKEEPKKQTKAGQRKKTNTFAERNCPKRRKPRTEKKCIVDDLPCRETASDRDFSPKIVKIKEKWKEHAYRIKEMQRVKSVILTYNSFRVTSHVGLPAHSVRQDYQWEVQELMYDLSEHKRFSSDIENAGKETSLKGTWPLEEKYLVNPEKLERIAKDLRILYRAGRLKRIIIRGYADRQEARRRKAVPLSKARAQFVRDQLDKHYSLAFPGIDVLVIGCGAYYARGFRDPKNRAVVIESEVREESEVLEPTKKQAEYVKRTERQDVRCWTFHRYKGQGWKKGFMRREIEVAALYRDRDHRNKRVITSNELIDAQEEALSYVRLFEQVVGEDDPKAIYEGKNAGVLEGIRRWINSWELKYPQESESARGVRELRGLEGRLVYDKETDSMKVQTDKSRKHEKPIYTITPPRTTSFSFSMDEQKSKKIKLNAAGIYPIHLDGMVVKFNVGMPPSPRA